VIGLFWASSRALVISFKTRESFQTVPAIVFKLAES
jgi:hypothetical protein